MFSLSIINHYKVTPKELSTWRRPLSAIRDFGHAGWLCTCHKLAAEQPLPEQTVRPGREGGMDCPVSITAHITPAGPLSQLT
jgi:hypothetical protein